MSRHKHTLLSMTSEMLKQFVSSLGYDANCQAAPKKMVQKDSYLTPDAYDLRMNSDERKNLQTTRAPR